jgi:hypothetical protein
MALRADHDVRASTGNHQVKMPVHPQHPKDPSLVPMQTEIATIPSRDWAWFAKRLFLHAHRVTLSFQWAKQHHSFTAESPLPAEFNRPR